MKWCYECNSFICTCKEEKEENPFLFINEPKPIEIPEIELPKQSCITKKPEFDEAVCISCGGFGLEPDMFIPGGNRICLECGGCGYVLVKKDNIYW